MTETIAIERVDHIGIRVGISIVPSPSTGCSGST
jgi:hypothetical protein